MDVVDHIKDIAKLINAAGNHELYERFGKLEKEIYNQNKELLELQKENDKLKQQLEEKNRPEYRNECYYFKDDGPYCPRCFDVENKKVHMLEEDNHLGTRFYVCPNCHTKVVKETYEHNLNRIEPPVSSIKF